MFACEGLSEAVPSFCDEGTWFAVLSCSEERDCGVELPLLSSVARVISVPSVTVDELAVSTLLVVVVVPAAARGIEEEGEEGVWLAGGEEGEEGLGSEVLACGIWI